MKQDLYKYLIANAGNMTVEEIATCFLASVVIGAVIFISYRFSHSNTVYSAKFNVSLMMLTSVTTLIMSVIGNNVALSLGMVGALSIVRFRTAIKDPRDTVYIFWCVAAGVCCGIQDFTVVAIGSATIFLIMLLLGNVRNNEKYLIIIRGNQDSEEKANNLMVDTYRNKISLRVANVTHKDMELIYEISESTLRKAGKKNPGFDIRAGLMEIEGVDSVNLVCQNDEITR
ncbi:DUF4956 domain-containing protein [Oribacterium sp. C9]|uniref:DUF4956 domain-containing protein n=1 Tax=Oribacterium sp. C9 TaxID=1943579 RepID=UPI00098FCF73|nr:DUF4956 domain-containing protein [Oribacterium sp. C9]OON87190.1 DUF4956 domain-containing protein [Oribacterium sp. C9]